jgi:hypothetical protein
VNETIQAPNDITAFEPVAHDKHLPTEVSGRWQRDIARDIDLAMSPGLRYFIYVDVDTGRREGRAGDHPVGRVQGFGSLKEALALALRDIDRWGDIGVYDIKENVVIAATEVDLKPFGVEENQEEHSHRMAEVFTATGQWEFYSQWPADQDLVELFKQCNDRYFDGRLPSVTIFTGYPSQRLELRDGLAVYRPRLLGEWLEDSNEMFISSDAAEHAAIAAAEGLPPGAPDYRMPVLIHEMVHVALSPKGGHGAHFCAELKRIAKLGTEYGSTCAKAEHQYLVRKRMQARLSRRNS